MNIGTCVVHLYLPNVNSLKQKRQIVKSIKEKTRNKFNVSIAEIDNYNLWRKVTLGMVCISNENSHAHSILSQAINFLSSLPDVEILSTEISCI